MTCIVHDWDLDNRRCRRCGLSLKNVESGRYERAATPSVAPPPPYVTVAECGHCFEDVGERA